MTLSSLRTGPRVVASFAIVLIIMACMSAVSLWRLQAASNASSDLVNDKLAKQQLTSELLGAVQLNGIRAVSIARSDSLEVGEYFQKQLDQGDKGAAALQKRIAALPQDPDEKALATRMAGSQQAYMALRGEMLKMKDMGRVQEVGDIVDNKLDGVFGAYVNTLGALLAYHTKQAQALARASEDQFTNSRRLLIGLGACALLIGSALAWLLTRSIVGPLGQAVAMAARVADGDLTASLAHRRRDEFGQLLDALSEMTRRLAQTVTRVRDGAVAIDAASREVASGNMDLSRRTEHQAGMLEETASAMDELSAMVRQNAANTRQADALSLSASAIAGKGGAVVADVVTTMAAIDRYAHRIADITGVIDGIAFQTNILALNAAVEAARAGEQGRGFAVVAGEVRNLAQRSATAAREIKQLIAESTAQIAAGSALAGSAGATMDEIVSSVGRVGAIVAAISNAGREQENGIVQIHAAIGDMDGVTQQNAALVEEAAAAAEAMRNQAAELAQLAGYFKVDGIEEETVPAVGTVEAAWPLLLKAA
jgi:methyl-accepting chemotaxis protein